MSKRILFLRHGKTEGNLLGRYIGANTDEALCEAGIEELLAQKDKIRNILSSEAEVFSSPMKRCIQTASVLFDEKELLLLEELKEIDFGEFENKNYQELNGNKQYQAWIDSGGKLDYPGGEGLKDFIDRSMKGFNKVLSKLSEIDSDKSEAIVVCHGGNIMAIMSTLTGQEYFDFQIKNAKGIVVELEEKEDRFDCLSYSFI